MGKTGKKSGAKPRAKARKTISTEEAELKPTAKAAASKGDDGPYLVGVKASYQKKDGRDRIVGLELRQSVGPPIQWGKILKTKMSAEVPFEKDEHIVGIDFSIEDEGVDSLTLFTSHYGGRAASFSTTYTGCNRSVDTSEDGGCYVGVYGQSKGSLSPKGKKFTCKQGNRVSGISFKNHAITSMAQEAIPEGCNERWWERSMDYSSDRDENKPKKRRSAAKSGKKTKKAKRSGGGASGNPPAFDEERHRRIMAQVERQSRAAMYDPDYDPDDFEGNRRRYGGGGTSYDYGSSGGSRNRYGYGSSYGFDGGCYGYGARDCDDLLEQGIKPWDDDAGAALGAMRGW